jgi:7-keto-8-aminopelargonate synthetase-like enzyme
LAEAAWVDAVDRDSRVMAGASPPPILVAAASAKALEIARTQPELRRKLRENVRHARAALGDLGWDAAPESPAPIVCLAAREGVDLIRIKAGLFEQGIAVDLVRSYTSTPPGGALRIALFATHTTDQIDRLAEGIKRLIS